MNTKNSKKIVPATVFAAIIVLLAFAVMSTTAIIPDDELVTTLDPESGGLGDVVDVRIGGTVEAGLAVNVEDTLPAEFTYIPRTFMVDGEAATPTVDGRVISYIIDNTAGRTALSYKIAFDVKVTEAYAWKVEKVTNVVKAGTEEATANFNIVAFTDLEETVNELTEPVIGTEAAWEITMRVTNNFDYAMTDTKITENFAGALKIDSIAVGATTYTFENYENYGTKEATVDIYKNGEPLQNNPRYLNKDGVITPQGSLYWTGMTHKAHFAWNIENLASDNSKDITIGVSTDKNPAGEQLYTETGDHELHSGATLKFIDDTRMQLSAVTAPIVVTAVDAVEPEA